MKSLVNDLLRECLGLFAALATARRIFLDAGNAALRKPAAPQAYRFASTAKLASDFLVEKSRGGQQRDAGPQHQSRGRGASACPTFQLQAVAV